MQIDIHLYGEGLSIIISQAYIEIDNCSPLEMLKLQTNLAKIADGEEIPFVYEKRQRKSELQLLYEELEECGPRLMKYKGCFEIMGKDRNSYSKTDLEAIFMRMKEDHMMNGQLKAAYNVQIAVENYFIIHVYVSNDRTDYNALIPVVKKHVLAFEEKLKEVTADSGYCSEKNLLFLKENDDFRRFNHRSSDKVYKEFMLYAIGRNINKYQRFLLDFYYNNV